LSLQNDVLGTLLLNEIKPPGHFSSIDDRLIITDIASTNTDTISPLNKLNYIF